MKRKHKGAPLKLGMETIRLLANLDRVIGGVTTGTDETWFCKSIDPYQGPC